MTSLSEKGMSRSFALPWLLESPRFVRVREGYRLMGIRERLDSSLRGRSASA